MTDERPSLLSDRPDAAEIASIVGMREVAGALTDRRWWTMSDAEVVDALKEGHEADLSIPGDVDRPLLWTSIEADGTMPVATLSLALILGKWLSGDGKERFAAPRAARYESNTWAASGSEHRTFCLETLCHVCLPRTVSVDETTEALVLLTRSKVVTVLRRRGPTGTSYVARWTTTREAVNAGLFDGLDPSFDVLHPKRLIPTMEKGRHVGHGNYTTSGSTRTWIKSVWREIATGESGIPALPPSSVLSRMEATFRRFFLHAPDPAMDAIRSAANLWFDRDVAIANLHARTASCDRPERLGQAFAQAPLLAFLGTMSMPHAPVDYAFKALDAGASPLSSLDALTRASDMGPLSPPALRTLAALPRCDLRKTAAAVGAALEPFGRHRPLSPEECSSILSVVACVTAVDDGSARPPLDRAAATRVTNGVRDAKGNYRDMPPRFEDVVSWVRRTGQQAIDVPRGRHHDLARRVVVEVLFPNGRRHGRLCDVSEKWHGTAARLAASEHESLTVAMAACGRTDVENLYPRLPDFQDPAHVTLVRLDTPEALATEGREMAHCVATMEREVSAGCKVVFSLVTSEGRSTLSLALVEMDGEPCMVIDQLFSRGNARSPDRHLTEAVSVAESLNRAEGLADYARRVREAEAYLEAREDLASWATPELRERLASSAYERLRTVMPRSYRAMTRTEFLTMVDAPDATSASLDRHENEGLVTSVDGVKGVAFQEAGKT